PPSIRFFRPPAVSLSTTTLLPVAFSKSGTRARTTCLKAPAVRIFTSAADANDVWVKRPTATTRASRVHDFMKGLRNAGDYTICGCCHTIVQRNTKFPLLTGYKCKTFCFLPDFQLL